ncbi:MAG: nuclear transport factor 2 family protein [Acidobacteria bacterium]|nr:nuclear transport factor 2 family protein [Acidobacteriota bacterium]
MKKCPSCGRFFDGDNDFCLDDGSPLENSATPASSPAPTVPYIPTVAGIGHKSTGTGIYFVVGAMGLVILSLSIVIYALAFRAPSPSAQDAVEKAVSAPNKAVAASTPDVNTAIGSPETPPLSAEAVRGLLARWEKSQNERSFAAYKNCYAQQFFGIKRTKSGRQSRMNYGVWMNDRSKMFRNVIDVAVDDPQITVEGDSATVVFIQRFRSVNYEDTGQKTLKLKMLPEGARIVFEELKYVY